MKWQCHRSRDAKLRSEPLQRRSTHAPYTVASLSVASRSSSEWTSPSTRTRAKPRFSRPPAPAPALSAAMQRSAGVIDRFLDGLWLEDGLAKNSLAAYRRDLTLFATWLADAEARDLAQSRASESQSSLR